LRWEDAYARSYAILVSTDGENWEEVHSTTACPGGTEVVAFPPVPSGT
jgi:hypothetical protein